MKTEWCSGLFFQQLDIGYDKPGYRRQTVQGSSLNWTGEPRSLLPPIEVIDKACRPVPSREVPFSRLHAICWRDRKEEGGLSRKTVLSVSAYEMGEEYPVGSRVVQRQGLREGVRTLIVEGPWWARLFRVDQDAQAS